MRIFHFVKVRFDIRREDINKEWLDTRREFFLQHTLVSLLNQTNKDWVLWIQCQNGMQEWARELEHKLDSIIGKYVITYSDGPVNPNKLDPYGEGDKLRLSDYVYVTRIDSDDLYAPDALMLARYCLPTDNGKTVQSSMFRRGYLYDINTKQLGVYNGPSTPFHTLMIPSILFLDIDKYKQYVWSLAGDHSKINRAFQTRELPDWKFTVLIHGHNFISDFNYSRESGYVPVGWSLDNFLNPPVVFDVDDFCNSKNCLEELRTLKEHYPNFNCTLFTVPTKTTIELLKEAHELGYVELCPHGFTHEPNEELKSISPERLGQVLKATDNKYYTKGFRPPGWFISVPHIQTLSELGYWVAIHERDIDKRPYCTNGYYVCGERLPYWHGHTHNVCGNWIKQHLLELLIKWPKEQKFSYVSEAVLKASL